MKIEAAGCTHIGQIRDDNEDSYLIDESLGLYVVCDGMGGQAAGEVASERSIAFVADYLRQHRSVIDDANVAPGGFFQVVKLVESAVQQASSQIFDLACADPNYRGMGTTMSVLLVVDEKAIMGHVGDSRVYVIRGEKIHQLSTDHTLANELLLAGSLTAEEAATSTYNHVLTRVIGPQESVQVETLMFDLFPRDICLLCSDGLSNYLSSAAQITDLIDGRDAESSVSALIEFANAQGGSDNITAIVLQTLSDEQSVQNAVSVQHRLNALKSCFLCRDVSQSKVIRLLNASSTIRCPAGQSLAGSLDQEPGLYIVLQGRVFLRQATGDEAELSRNDCFGHTSLVGEGKLTSGVEIADDAELLFISRRNFENLTQRLPRLGRQLYKNLAEELSQNLVDDLSSTGMRLSDTGEWHPDELK